MTSTISNVRVKVLAPAHGIVHGARVLRAGELIDMGANDACIWEGRGLVSFTGRVRILKEGVTISQRTYAKGDICECCCPDLAKRLASKGIVEILG